MNHTILIDIVILLAAAVLVVPLFQSLRLGAVLGFLAAGLLVGPAGLGLITEVGEIRGVAELGIVFLLFMIGIELKPARLWLMRRMVFGLGSIQVIVTTLVLALLLTLFGYESRTALVLALGLALSSTAFVLQILTDTRQLSQPHGRVIFAILLMQDLAVVPMLLLIPMLAQPETTVSGDLGLALAEAVGVLLAVGLIGRYLLRPAMQKVAHYGSREIFMATGLLLVLGTALAVEMAGLSMAMGAFIAGLLIANSEFRHQVMADIAPFRGMLLGLFFMSVGMMINLSLLVQNPLQIVLMLVVLVAVKALLLLPVARKFGVSWADSKSASLLLAQGGEFAFVLFSAALAFGLLSQHIFQQAVLVVALSMVVTPLLAYYAAPKVKVADKSSSATDWDSTEIGESHEVIIVGFGRMGERVAALLKSAGLHYAAIERRTWQVSKGRSKGYNVFYGDISNSDVLHHVGTADAAMMVIAVDDVELVMELVKKVRSEFPHLPIFARGHNRGACERLLDAGATNVASENLEASLQLSRFVMERSQVEAQQVEELLEGYRGDYYDYLKLK